MSIKRGKLEFQNVLSMTTKCRYDEWGERVGILKLFILNNDLFVTGPVILRWNEIEDKEGNKELTIYVPIYQKIQMEENETFKFNNSLCIKDGLKIRHVEEEEIRTSEHTMEQVAEQMQIKLEKPYYYIYLPVYGEYIIDVYAPILEEEEQ